MIPPRRKSKKREAEAHFDDTTSLFPANTESCRAHDAPTCSLSLLMASGLLLGLDHRRLLHPQ